MFPLRSALAVTAVVSVCWTPTGWAKTPHTNSSRSSWSIPSTRPSDATPTRNGSRRPCTSTGKCAASRQPARRAVAWARATSSTSPSAALAVQPGDDATLCSCTVTARERVAHLYIHQNKVPFYGHAISWCHWFCFFCCCCFLFCFTGWSFQHQESLYFQSHTLSKLIRAIVFCIKWAFINNEVFHNMGRD